MTLLDHINRATGAGAIPQDIQDVAREIALSENNTELLRHAKRFKQLVLASAQAANSSNTFASAISKRLHNV